MFDIKIDLKNSAREAVFLHFRDFLESQGFGIADEDQNRPWGGFFVIDERDLEKFRSTFFKELPAVDFPKGRKFSPKLLLVEPEKRLSWQYHHRRAEVWKLIAGTSGIVRSETDEQKDLQEMKIGALVKLSQGERHRLVGLKTWGIVAEIWMHTDPANPSDEEDIVRVADDFSRK